MSSHLYVTNDSVSTDPYMTGHNHSYFPSITTGNINHNLRFNPGMDIGITAPKHLLHISTVDISALNQDERRDDEMLHKSVFLDAVADSHDVKLTREQRQIIKDMDNDDWQYFVARLLLGAELVPLIESFKEEPQLVKVVKE